jgi:hypothetical protein
MAITARSGFTAASSSAWVPGITGAGVADIAADMDIAAVTVIAVDTHTAAAADMRVALPMREADTVAAMAAQLAPLTAAGTAAAAV